MRILLTGATGFVGRALCERLLREGHGVIAWVRSQARAREVLGPGVELLEVPRDAAAAGAGLEGALATCDAVVHLAGEPILPKRWTEARKQALADSRVGLAQTLVEAMGRCPRAPRVYVGASAVGYYGDRGDEVLTEDSAPGQDFLARLCVRWEAAGERARDHGARVVSLRSGIVLGPDGGVLAALERPFRLGLGGRLGTGRQYVAWIALEDIVEMYARALVDERMSGPFHATAPEPVTNRRFTQAIGQALGRPTLLPAPSFGLKLLLGEAASTPLSSQRAVPQRWTALGLGFHSPDLDATVRAAFHAVQPAGTARIA